MEIKKPQPDVGQSIKSKTKMIKHHNTNQTHKDAAAVPLA
jgi:hypothetical protein